MIMEGKSSVVLEEIQMTSQDDANPMQQRFSISTFNVVTDSSEEETESGVGINFYLYLINYRLSILL